MDQDTFEAKLRSDGYTQIEIKVLDPKLANAEHEHDHDIRGMVLDGIFVVRQDDRPVTFLAGEVFSVPAGRKHSEEIGPEGARIVLGRNYHKT